MNYFVSTRKIRPIGNKATVGVNFSQKTLKSTRVLCDDKLYYQFQKDANVDNFILMPNISEKYTVRRLPFWTMPRRAIVFIGSSE